MKEDAYETREKPVSPPSSAPPGDQFTIPTTDYKFVLDTYTPTVKAQPHAQPDLRPIGPQPMSQDHSDSSATKTPERSTVDLNGKEDDKSTILSRQIPIIKVIGDLQDVSTLNIGKIPTYKSDGLNEPKPKIAHKDVFKHFDRELNVLTLKKELNDLKRNFDMTKETRLKRRPDEESDRKEDGLKQIRLDRNFVIMKETNPEQGPRRIEFRPSLRNVKSVPKLKRKESKDVLIFKSDQSLKKGLEGRKGSAGRRFYKE